MRETLFTGKRVDNGEWVEGFYVFVPEHHKPEMSRKSYIVSVNNGLYFEVYPETVGQYIGVTDKNGKKIFEGNIVKYKEVRRIYMIGYDEYSMEYTFLYYHKELKNTYCGGFVRKSDGKSIEVIGNIHDNPELLEIKK